MHALCLVGLSMLPAVPPDALFDLKTLLAPPLQSKTLKLTEKNGIVTEEVMLHAETDGDKRVDIFAYFSYPTGAKRLPAFIWNQGGLGQATTYWTEFGAKRGYATLCIDFPIPGYRSTGGYPINSGLALTDDPRAAPIYHGAVALLRAVSYLETRPEVNAQRIGMAGSSWGGFYTTLMIGLDPRLKAGSCMFGCGALQLGNLWWDGSGWDAKRDTTFRERWSTTLDPATRLASTKTPLAWFTGTNDQFYWMPALMKSHELAAGPKHLSLLANWNHALTEELDEQVFAWLDVHLQDKPAFLQVTPVQIAGNAARWQYTGPRKVARAELLLSPGASGYWQSRHWQTLKADVADQTCTAMLPGGDLPCFLSGTVIDDAGFRYSTPLLQVAPATSRQASMLNYDGCSEWGDFEAEHISTCSRHGWPTPPLAKDAKSGKQCALLKNKWSSPPVLGTAGVPHRLSCWLRSTNEITATVAIGGRFDGQMMSKEKAVTLGDRWQEVELDFTPPTTLTASLQLNIAVSKGGEVRLDSVTFRPR